MDQNNNQEKETNLSFPFQAMPSEDQFHLFHSISVTVSGQNDKEVQFSPIAGSILITNERLCWFNLSKQENEVTAEEKQQLDAISKEQDQKKILASNLNGKSFMFNYDNLVSHGLQGNNFICFLGSQEEEEMELEEEQEELEELIKQVNSAEIVNLEKGQYQINFDFSQQTKEIQSQIIEIFTQYSSANVDMEEEGDDFLDEMITADNIDQDGNIIIKKIKNEEDDQDNEEEEDDADYEDVDDEDEQEGANGNNKDNQFEDK